jgi:4-diphosphocytidyl-2-C-methyl-D-erythritol kinase
MAESTWPAPAKLNLFLHILGREPSGYHRLQSLYQILDWGDELDIQATGTGPPVLRAPTPGVPADQDLALRAARLLQQHTGSSAGAVIRVRKRIPLGAGLGGGSSDAATVLCVLNKLWACDLDRAELAELGLQLGADVPLFVHGHTAWGEGRGERLSPLAQGEQWYVLVLPDLRISTAEVFGDPDLKRDSRTLAPDDYRFDRTRNDCQPAVLARYPKLREMVAELSDWGAPRMTGTGSAFFIRVADEATAQEITRALNSRYNVRAVRGVDQSMLLEKLAGAC